MMLFETTDRDGKTRVVNLEQVRELQIRDAVRDGKYAREVWLVFDARHAFPVRDTLSAIQDFIHLQQEGTK
jgi:hypothetical protein